VPFVASSGRQRYVCKLKNSNNGRLLDRQLEEAQGFSCLPAIANREILPTTM